MHKLMLFLFLSTAGHVVCFAAMTGIAMSAAWLLSDANPRVLIPVIVASMYLFAAAFMGGRNYFIEDMSGTMSVGNSRRRIFTKTGRQALEIIAFTLPFLALGVLIRKIFPDLSAFIGSVL